MRILTVHFKHGTQWILDNVVSTRQEKDMFCARLGNGRKQSFSMHNVLCIEEASWEDQKRMRDNATA